MAAKTVVEAVDAATAPGPRTGVHVPESPAHRPHAPPAPLTPPRPPATPRAAPNHRNGSRRFGEALWTPFARLSGVLWLEITGVFFGLFALSAGVGAWRLRNQWHRDAVNPDGHTHLLLTIAVALLFGYFCITSFVRARARS